MIGTLILGVLLFAQPLLAQDSTTPPDPQSEQAIERQIEEQIEQSIDEEAIERQVEQQIDRIMGQVNPSEWRLPAVLALLTPFGVFALLALIGWLLFRRGQMRTQARMEFHRQLLEKFSSGREFSEFMESKGSKQLLEGLWSEKVNAKDRILQTMRGGVVLTVLGMGALALSWREQGLFVPGAFIAVLGAGLLLSTAISYRLSKNLGLLRDEKSDSESESTSLS